MKLIFTKRGLRKKITNKTNGEVYLHDISVCNTNLLWRVSISCFKGNICVYRDPFWLCGPLIGYLKAKELI